MSLLHINELSVSFGTKKCLFRAVDGLNLTVEQGEIISIAGESGSGKSVSMMALMGLLQGQGRVEANQLLFDGKNLLTLSNKARRKIIGKDIAMIFQDPMTSLNPSYTVGFQLMEVLRLHHGLRAEPLKRRALELMERVEIPAAASRLDAYPHQLSGGMSQRVMIAMAIACNPKLLIADEPTTALDVTIQAQIMKLLVDLQHSQNMALVLITHDLAVAAEVAQRMVIMYAGQVVEQGEIPQIFHRPAHPYTAALLASIPEQSTGTQRLSTLPGIVPGQYNRPQGCLLAPRCPHVQMQCQQKQPGLVQADGVAVRCFYPYPIHTKKKTG